MLANYCIKNLEHLNEESSTKKDAAEKKDALKNAGQKCRIMPCHERSRRVTVNHAQMLGCDFK